MAELTTIDGVGEIVALQLRDGIQLRKTFIIDLLSLLNIQEETQIVAGGHSKG